MKYKNMMSLEKGSAMSLVQDLLKKFVNDVTNAFLSGKATEGSYYPALKVLFEEYAKVKGVDSEVIVHPKLSQGGMPDLLLRRQSSIVGHIEVKDIPTKLEDIEKTKQLTTYRHAYPNLLLTDLLTFVFFRDGKKVAIAKLADSARATRSCFRIRFRK